MVGLYLLDGVYFLVWYVDVFFWCMLALLFGASLLYLFQADNFDGFSCWLVGWMVDVFIGRFLIFCLNRDCFQLVHS